MDEATRKLHEQLIRLAKGMLTAWEQWLSSRAEPKTEQEPSASSPAR